MIKRHIILFTSQLCGPCAKELEALVRLRKLTNFPKEENRFIIVDILSEEHSMWVELFRPTATPEVKIVDLIKLEVEVVFSGEGCIDKAWRYLDIPGYESISTGNFSLKNPINEKKLTEQKPETPGNIIMSSSVNLPEGTDLTQPIEDSKTDSLSDSESAILQARLQYAALEMAKLAAKAKT
jgi:hypothetical protein